MKDFNKDWEQYNFESVTPVISWPWNWVPKKKEKQKLESWVSVRPQHLQTNLLKQSKGRWAAKSSSKRLWVWGAKGLLPSVQWTSLPGAVNCHNSNVASTGPREGKEHMGEKGRKKKKKMRKGEYRSCAFTFIWDLLHSCSWGHPLQSLHPLPSTQLAH